MQNKRARNSIIAAFILLLFFALILIAIYYKVEFTEDYSAINHIKEFQKGPNHFSDTAHDIDVAGPEDIGYIVKGEFDLEIYYGRQRISVHRKSFSSKKYKEALASIGIEIKYHENEDGSIIYLVTYWGTPVDEYVRAS